MMPPTTFLVPQSPSKKTHKHTCNPDKENSGHSPPQENHIAHNSVFSFGATRARYISHEVHIIPSSNHPTIVEATPVIFTTINIWKATQNENPGMMRFPPPAPFVAEASPPAVAGLVVSPAGLSVAAGLIVDPSAVDTGLGDGVSELIDLEDMLLVVAGATVPVDGAGEPEGAVVDGTGEPDGAVVSGSRDPEGAVVEGATEPEGAAEGCGVAVAFVAVAARVEIESDGGTPGIFRSETAIEVHGTVFRQELPPSREILLCHSVALRDYRKQTFRQEFHKEIAATPASAVCSIQILGLLQHCSCGGNITTQKNIVPCGTQAQRPKKQEVRYHQYSINRKSVHSVHQYKHHHTTRVSYLRCTSDAPPTPSSSLGCFVWPTPHS